MDELVSLMRRLRNLREEECLTYAEYKEYVETLVGEAKDLLFEIEGQLDPRMRREIKDFLYNVDEKTVFEKHMLTYWILRRILISRS